MIKAAAIMLIILGFAFFGHCITGYQQNRVDALNEIVRLISFMKTRLRYDCLPLSALLKAYEENGKRNVLAFVGNCRESTEHGKPFSAAWRESIENDRELNRLLKNVTSSLINLGEDLGTTDLEGQLSCCDYYEKIFSDELCEREEQNKKYSKLCPVLGAMLGIWAAILIV